MKALSVRQPWAELIAAGHKPVENRASGTDYRGPLAIHASLALSAPGLRDPRVVRALGLEHRPDERDYAPGISLGAIVAVVDLVGCHRATTDGAGCCCAPWGDPRHVNHTARGPDAGRVAVHLVLARPRLVDPVPCRGQLGVWAVPDDIAAQLRESGR